MKMNRKQFVMRKLTWLAIIMAGIFMLSGCSSKGGAG